MNYSNMNREDLLADLRKAQERIADLERGEDACRAVEEALQESEHNFRFFFESMTDPLWVCTPDGAIHFTNTAAATTLGYGIEELRSMNVLDVHPSDKRQEVETIFRDMLQGLRKTCPLPLARKDGSLVPVETRIWKGTWNGLDCIFGISKNLSAEQESLQRFERLFQFNPNPMALSSLPDRRFVDVNNSWVTTLGLTREETLGRTAVELGIIEDANILNVSSQQVLQDGKSASQELLITCKDGSIRSGIISGEVIQNQGKHYLLSVMVDITERKGAEEKLQRQSALISSLLDSIPDIIFFKDINGTYLGGNSRFEEFVGLPKDDFIGRTDHDLFPEEVAAEFRRHDAAMLAQGSQRSSEEWITYPDGTRKLIDTVKSPCLGPNGEMIGLIGVSRDITSRKRAEQALQLAYSNIEHIVAERTEELAYANAHLLVEVAERKQAHREIDQILSSITAVLVGLDSNGTVTRWNQAAQETFNLSAETVVGKRLDQLQLPDSWGRLAESIEAARNSGKATRINNIYHISPGGKQIFHVVTITPLLAEHGTPDGFLILGEDVSEMKFLEAQLAQTAKLEAVGQLAAGIAHEINTPVQYIGDSMTFLDEACDGLNRLARLTAQFPSVDASGSSDLVMAIKTLSTEIDLELVIAEIPKTIDRIFHGIDRVSSIVQAMKRFSLPVTEGMRQTDIWEHIESTLVISRNEWRYVADVITEFDPELEAIHCNPAEINQVLLNLIINAAHAIGEGVHGTSKKGLITITTRKDGDYAVILVQDNGPGIPEDIRDKVFNLFFTTKDVGRGTGQGLAISHDIVVNKHGGLLDFETEPGKGTTFRVRLPLKPID